MPFAHRNSKYLNPFSLSLSHTHTHTTHTHGGCHSFVSITRNWPSSINGRTRKAHIKTPPYFLHYNPNHHRTIRNGSTTPYLATVSTINFHYLPTVSPPIDPSNPANIIILNIDIPRLNNPNLHKTLISISRSCNIKAFIIDFFCNAAMEVSKQLCIPTYYFFACGGYGLAFFLYTPIIDKITTKSFKDMDTTFDDIPGLPPLHATDFPMLMLDRTTKLYAFQIETATAMANSSAGIIVNTFEMFEREPIKVIKDGLCVLGGRTPPVFCIGPLISTNDNNGSTIKGSDCGDKHECLSWLDSQPSRSVVFLSFGSMGLFMEEQLKEMAIGMERSGLRFLWVVRKPPPINCETMRALANSEPPPSLDSFLPLGFLDRIKDRGYVVRDWAPQVDVLTHDSVGGFVTHCGWNSILESICGGVPMLTWPLYAEQKLNRVALVDGMKVALKLNELKDGFVSATELEERLKELMDSEKGKAMRERVKAFKDGAMVAISECGSSRNDLTKFIESLK